MDFWCLIKSNQELMEFFRFISVSNAPYPPWEVRKGEVKDEAEAPIGRNR
jgi:hypothetical protein